MEREQLGARLRQLRTNAGLTGGQLAGLLGLDQSTVSRIENAKTLPRVEQIEAWVTATKADPDTRTELLDLLEDVATQVASWRTLYRAGLRAKQEDVRELEAQATAIRIFQPVCVPGLLQIAEYAKLMLTSPHLAGPSDVAEAVRARLERQTILFDESRRFEFIITEAALRWRPGSVQVQRAQLAHLESIASLSNVELGVIPLDVVSPLPYMHLFVVHELPEETVVTLETVTAELQVRDSRDVEVYQEYLEQARELALRGDEATAMVRTLAT